MNGEHDTMESAPVLAAQGLSKVFKDFWGRTRARAVADLDLTVRPGQVVGLLGPNGSGKSTTIKMILGLLHPTAGHVTVLGGSPRDRTVRARIGYLPEHSYLYGYLTARETLTFYGRLFDLTAKERRRRVTELLALTGLTDAADRPVGEFSKGMGRRLGFAQALLNDPAFLILDEPTAGLDPLACRQVKTLLDALSARGMAILLTSHLLADVESVCDRVLIMHAGRARAEGALSELLEERERLCLTVPALDAETTRKVLDTLRSLVGSEPDLSHPAMRLETFFAEVIRAAGDGGAAAPDDARGVLPPFMESLP